MQPDVKNVFEIKKPSHKNLNTITITKKGIKCYCCGDLPLDINQLKLISLTSFTNSKSKLISLHSKGSLHCQNSNI